MQKLHYYILQLVVRKATGKLFHSERHKGLQYSLDNCFSFLQYSQSNF